MNKRSLVLKSAALLSAAGLMTGYVIYQADGGDGKLLPGSKSRPVAARGPSSSPTTAPVTPSQPRIFHGSKSAAVVDTTRIDPSGNTVVGGTITLIQPSSDPTLMGGSKSTVMIHPSATGQSGTITLGGTTYEGGTIIFAPSTLPTTQPSTQPTHLLVDSDGKITIAPATRPASTATELNK